MSNHFRSRLAGLVCVPLLSGCILFHADFEADTAGAPPNPDPPSPPEGDEIFVWATTPPNILVVSDPLFGNSLRHAPQVTISQVDFIGVETRRAVPEFTALWDGCADRWSNSTPRYNFAVGSNTTGFAHIEIENGEFRVDGERLASLVMGQIHTVRVEVDNRAGTYTATVAQANSALGGEGASCANAGTRRSACPDGFRFERGSCRSGPNWLLWRSHCPLGGRNSCATCRGDEVLDTMNGTCIDRTGARTQVTSGARPISEALTTDVQPVKIVAGHDNSRPSAPAAYLIDDIWIVRPRD